MRNARARQVTARRAACALTILALAQWAATARCAPLSDIPGAFVDVGTGAGAVGMAGAVIAGGAGADAVFWNPATIGSRTQRPEFAASYCDHMGLVPYAAVSASVPLSPALAVGGGVLYSGDDALSEMTVVAGVGRAVGAPPWCGTRPARVGAALKGRRASYGNNASVEGQVTGDALGGGVDLGALVPVTPELTLGVVCRDLANTLRWNSSARGSYSEGVPPALLIGLAAEPRSGFSIEVDLDKALRADTADVVSAGAALWLGNVAVLRCGYRRSLPPDRFDEYAVGCGAAVPAGHGRISMDVAYLFGRLEDTLRLTLGFSP
ncbi:MAG: hypothetical protein FJY74_06415 [Candidatus Eisenbacteria bacterium]|nr:hypothetical protein [Candidatus Eisenbacteria bacterium]